MRIDDLIVEFDKGLRTLAGVPRAARPMPAGDVDRGDNVEPAALSPEERQEAAALMRVNHCGEICAQALYQGQAMASENAELKRALEQAAREEEDHLAWAEQRIAELGGRTSLLNPLWYAGSLVIGFAAGRLGDAWNLGFLKETERQVERHLQGHLDRLCPADTRTRAVVAAMQLDEAAHARTAEALGARELPRPVKDAMAAAAKVMTTVSYRV
jgi:ubiquinone biosynthesis monooxygenase Coq7